MQTVSSVLDSISDVGRDASRGGYSRGVFTHAELSLREWFSAEATARGLAVETDRNGILWAWWDATDTRDGALVTGSHLDSVPGGGAFDGPLGVASALVAVDLLRGRGVQPNRSLAVAVFPEEEGSRFGVSCLGSRLLTGTLDPDHVRSLVDADGTTFADAARSAGIDVDHLGRDEEAARRIGDFVELHVEQGRGLIDLDSAVAIGSTMLGHGRWRLSVTGQGNHAGTTLMADRADPMIAAAQVVLAARRIAAEQDGARATVGRLQPIPGGTNVIASRVDLWLDVRHEDDAITAQLIEKIHGQAQKICAFEGCRAALTEESRSSTVHFDGALQRTLSNALGTSFPGAPTLPTGAGHDAGILGTIAPTAMLFVRNPTGISHSPEEFVERDDADAGATALADVLQDLL
ncbi:allantoate amidohydrolase [Arthrobacter agilis]|uniref:allantoate amidohydrolase n=1 Tax=Arthrobacter agilis TaxID=37921 RepID=UPI000B3530F9|nr:allantoate amidohydrolase [Arthrobacter agilis]OUM40430.1 allantoate amidohydrolase [Arthrobacter agilis]PPB45045.1 allantoate amidohydrolase [Arthrobacter agilis]TPV27748.1 allantoate amidohydrolase [Arthrobacter agilis]VDR31606.1 N-carbamoyl-L-amino acid hydrolase [Arthrobacter agilis]